VCKYKQLISSLQKKQQKNFKSQKFGQVGNLHYLCRTKPKYEYEKETIDTRAGAIRDGHNDGGPKRSALPER
jgi:hypothetical protein